MPIFQREIEPEFGSFSTASTPEESRDGKKDKEGDRASEEGKQKGKGSKPLMPTSTILRLLAELVRSYVGIATLIANYSYTVGQSELIKEVIFPVRLRLYTVNIWIQMCLTLCWEPMHASPVLPGRGLLRYNEEVRHFPVMWCYQAHYRE